MFRPNILQFRPKHESSFERGKPDMYEFKITTYITNIFSQNGMQWKQRQNIQQQLIFFTGLSKYGNRSISGIIND